MRIYIWAAFTHIIPCEFFTHRIENGKWHHYGMPGTLSQQNNLKN